MSAMTRAEHQQLAAQYRQWARNAAKAAESLVGDLRTQDGDEAAETCADAIKRLQDATSDFAMAAHHERQANNAAQQEARHD